MAAGQRKLMFDNKKPTWSYGICIAVVCEVIHMILIFLTNMDNASYAFEFVKGATLPMVLGNAAAVGFAIIIVSLLSHERFTRKKGSERIANTFQRWLLVCVVLAFGTTTLFSHAFQTRISYASVDYTLKASLNDVRNDIRDVSDRNLLALTHRIAENLPDDPARWNLMPLAATYGVTEINVVDENGMTNIPGVFAAGDVVSGPKTVVEAVAYTKKVAENIEQYCLNKYRNE